MSNSIDNPLAKKLSKKNGPLRNSTENVTLDDVARLAGVSTITVSRSLNYPDKVAATTLEKVTKAINQTGYVPNLLAGGLASRRTRLIAAIIPWIANMVYAETIQYFSARLREAGYQVLLGESGYPEKSEQSLISAVLSRRPDGILLTGIHHSSDCRRIIMAANIPVVETWDLTPTPMDMVVGFSHDRIGEAVADFLFKKEFRRIGFVTASDQRAQLRANSTIKRLKIHGIDDISTATVNAPTDLSLGRDGLVELIATGFDQGIVICSSDILAHGVLIEAQSRGMRIPEDLSILGFGDQSFATYTFPALSTVRIDRPLMGKTAANMLLKRILGETVDENVIDVGFKIVERETT